MLGAGMLIESALHRRERHPAGDHTLFIGEVEAVTTRDLEPLLYYRGRYGRFA